MSQRAPGHLIEAMKLTTALIEPMAPGHIQETKDWIFNVIASTGPGQQMDLTTFEISLLAHALSSSLYLLSTVAMLQIPSSEPTS